MKIQKLFEGTRVEPLRWALQARPDLWDLHTARTESPTSPHHGCSDIWVRYGPPGIGNEPHVSQWYPVADQLPVRDLVAAIFEAVGGKELGGVLITRIPPGQMVKPHQDHGWHARHYEKFALQIDAAPGQLFCFDGEELETRPGDIFWFDNQFTHWVINPTRYERMTMIVCIRR